MKSGRLTSQFYFIGYSLMALLFFVHVTNYLLSSFISSLEEMFYYMQYILMKIPYVFQSKYKYVM